MYLRHCILSYVSILKGSSTPDVQIKTRTKRPATLSESTHQCFGFKSVPTSRTRLWYRLGAECFIKIDTGPQSFWRYVTCFILKVENIDNIVKHLPTKVAIEMHAPSLLIMDVCRIQTNCYMYTCAPLVSKQFASTSINTHRRTKRVSLNSMFEIVASFSTRMTDINNITRTLRTFITKENHPNNNGSCPCGLPHCDINFIDCEIFKNIFTESVWVPGGNKPTTRS